MKQRRSLPSVPPQPQPQAEDGAGGADPTASVPPAQSLYGDCPDGNPSAAADCVTNMSTLETPSAPRINVRLFAGDTDVDRSTTRRASILKSLRQEPGTEQKARPSASWWSRLFGGTTAPNPVPSVRPYIVTPNQTRTPKTKIKKVKDETDFYLITSYAILCAIFSVCIAIAVKIYL